MTPLANGGFKIGPIFVRDTKTDGVNKLLVGIWNESVEPIELGVNDLIELRRFITDSIIEIKLMK